MVHESPQPPDDAHRSSPSESRNPYLTILRTPGAATFSAAAVIARLPMSMVGIGTVLMVENLYGGYALAGQVAATLVVATAICAPQIARFVDRYGQRRVTLPLLVVSTVGLGGLILSAANHAPPWALFACAVVTGATGAPFGSMVRARWTYVLHDRRTLHTAFSLESALDELVFVIGPALTAFLAVSVSPEAGLIVPMVAAVVGGVWFLSQTGSEPPVIAADVAEPRRSAILAPGMIVLAIVFVGMGIIFGATDVSTIAFAEEQGKASMSGVALGIFALGSGISGLLYGARHWLSPLWRRYAMGMIALACGVSLFSFVNSIPALAGVMFIAGFAIAPTLINGNNLVQNLVTPNQLTEGLAWVGTSLGVGVSIGSSIAGVRIDASGAEGGFQVVMAAAGLAVVLTLAGSMSLRREGPREKLDSSSPDPKE